MYCIIACFAIHLSQLAIDEIDLITAPSNLTVKSLIRFKNFELRNNLESQVRGKVYCDN